MPRLIHLNGPPAIGTSTLARRYAGDVEGTYTALRGVLG